jgi:hypothetical protein
MARKRASVSEQADPGARSEGDPTPSVGRPMEPAGEPRGRVAGDWVIWGQTLVLREDGSVLTVTHSGPRGSAVTHIDVGSDVPGGGAV